MPSQRVDQLMAIIAKTPEVDHAFRELCKNYANYGTKTGDWLEADDGKQFLEVAGPNMPGPGQQIMFRRDGVRIVESTTDTPKRYVSSWLTFDEYELVHGEHPSEIFIRNWKAEINAYLRWQRLAVRDVTMQDFNVCYQTTEGGVSNESVTAVDELAVRLWLDRYHMRRVQIEPITVPATVTE